MKTIPILCAGIAALSLYADAATLSLNGVWAVSVECGSSLVESTLRPLFKSYDGGADVTPKASAPSCETALREGFANPPTDVKIGCYYYWVNERVDEEGVKKDLQWMKENGITRAFLATDIRNRTRFENPWEGQEFGDCAFMGDKWWRCLRTAFKTAGELGIEMGIFNCPGWSQSGGPWVAKEDAQIAPDGTYPENGPCSPAATGYEVDKTNRAAVRRHFDAFVGEILRRIPPEERPTLTTVVVDSWERGRVVKRDGDSRRLSDIIAEEYMGELTRCAHEHGLITWCEPYSHSRGGWDGDSATYGAAADEVAAEFWAGEPKNERAKEIKAALGAARLGGKNKIYAESFTAGRWKKFAKDDWSFESLKPYADKFFRKGVNATILHVVISQPGDDAAPPVRPWFGTFFDRRSKNAAEMKKLVPYLRRCNFMLQQGRRREDGRADTRILPDGTRIRFTDQSLFEVAFPDGRIETWNPVSGRTEESGADEGRRVVRNDAWWNTVDGRPIYSNGGGCYFYEGRWYWYGCKYEESEHVRFDPSFRVDVGGLHATFAGVTCYSSSDLVNWRDEGIVYAGEGAKGDGRTGWFGRVGVAAVPSEGKFVLAMQYMGGVLLAVADSPRGPFVFQEGVDMTESIGWRTTGDQSVFYDDVHGKGYLVFSKPHGRDKTYVAELGYRDGRAYLGEPTLVFEGYGREGNCMFMHGAKYYICASDLYGWDGSRCYWMVADSPTGPYRKAPDGDMFLLRNAVQDYCHISQTGFFVTVRGTERETVIFCGDRWTQFADNGIGFNVWTPLSFDGVEPVFNSLSEWTFDAATGRWAVGGGNNYVRNGSFDADRRQIPIRKKPDQDFVSGWTIEPGGGFLNATNMPSDKAFVTGKFALNLPAPFPRRASQRIESIPNGKYLLRYWRDDGNGWQRHEKSASVTNGTFDVEFTANAPCRIDDVSLVSVDSLQSPHTPPPR